MEVKDLSGTRFDYDHENALLETFRKQRHILHDVLVMAGKTPTVQELAKLTELQSKMVEVLRNAQS